MSVTINESKKFYHNLLDGFLTSVKGNRDSFLELRVQDGILRYKISTTQKPWSTYAGPSSLRSPRLNRPPSFNRPPPPILNLESDVSAKDTNLPDKVTHRRQNKRPCHAILTPSPTSKPSTNQASSDTPKARPDLSLTDDQPEILRQEEQTFHNLEVSDLSYDDAEDDDNPLHTSPFETPNPFSVLSLNESSMTQTDSSPKVSSDDSTSLEDSCGQQCGLVRCRVTKKCLDHCTPECLSHYFAIMLPDGSYRKKVKNSEVHFYSVL